AVLHGQGAPGDEVVLHVDDEKDIALARFHLFSSALRRSARRAAALRGHHAGARHCARDQDTAGHPPEKLATVRCHGWTSSDDATTGILVRHRRQYPPAPPGVKTTRAMRRGAYRSRRRSSAAVLAQAHPGGGLRGGR